MADQLRDPLWSFEHVKARSTGGGVGAAHLLAVEFQANLTHAPFWKVWDVAIATAELIAAK